MVDNDQEKSIYRYAGYAELVKRYDLDVIPNWHTSLVTTSGIHRIDLRGGIIEEVYPPKYWPGDTLGDHLEFALKYDGTNLWKRSPGSSCRWWNTRSMKTAI